MTDWTGVATVLAAATGLVVAVGKLLIDFYTLKRDVRKIELATNSMMKAMLADERMKGKLEGAMQERSEEKQRQDKDAADSKGSEEDPIVVKIKEE